MKEVPAICGLCPQGCWVRAHLSDGELVAVTADPHPRYGNCCERGRLAPRIVYSSDRIGSPLVRSGPKGALSFRRASWDEALDRIASAFLGLRDRHGARSVASYMGAGTLEDGLTAFFRKFLEPFGSPNDIDCGSVCYVSSRILAPLTTLGVEADAITPDFENADVIVLWGTNPASGGLPEKMQRIRQGRARGAKLIVVDPRRTALAADADLWLPVLPGTDGALALAVMHHLIRNGWYDRDFVARWTHGFDDLAAAARQFTPEAASEICGVPVRAVELLAGMIKCGVRTAMDFYSGLEYAPSGVQSTRALYCLAALTGNLDRQGGLLIHRYPHGTAREHAVDPASPALGAREYPLFHGLTGRAHIAGLPDAVLNDDPYPVRGLLIAGGSPALSYPGPELWRSVYERLDFLAVIDRFPPEEAAWADVMLPAATYYEIDSFHLYRDHVRRRERVIDPVGEARNDCLILADLAARLGFGRLVPRTEQEIVDQGLVLHARAGASSSPDSLSGRALPPHRTRKHESGLLRADGRPGFPTPTGRFEFASTVLVRYGHSAVPEYTDPRCGDGMAAPLMLTTGARTRAKFNSQYLDRPELAVKHRPVLEMNPCDAAARGIGNGDTVQVVTGEGELTLEARVTGTIRAGVVHAPAAEADGVRPERGEA